MCDTRKVKKDATIALNKQVYEVPQALIGRSITVRYDPDDPSKAFVKVGEPPSLVTVYQVRPVDNARIIRRQNAPPQIDYAALYGGGDGQPLPSS
ncbi:Mu transposase C-terminal domain-containing protein [Moorella sulfitireducens]|uniref:Mu transposase C-terminal domain-containing protein n=1 Tax=Neomoorella sulfitireducens TaxID=2972948 RepID=UPI003BF5FFCE